jgi:hypothetical protein
MKKRKLKRKIVSLQLETAQLTHDVGILIDRPESIEAVGIKVRHQMAIDLQERVFFGDGKPATKSLWRMLDDVSPPKE